MNTRRMGAAVAAAALATRHSPPAVRTPATPAPTRAASGDAAASGLKVGIKFDQPGLGLKKGTEYTGFDVDVAKYVAKELGTDAADITWVQAPSAQRETLIETGQVDMVVATYSITDTRKEKVSFAGPYFIAGQDLLVRADDTSITGPDTLDGQEALLGHRVHLGPEGQGQVPGGAAAGVRDVLRVPARPRQRRCRRPDHRRHDPRRLRGAARVRGQVQGRRQAVLRGELRRRPQEGRHRHVREGQRRRSPRWSRTARGRRPSTPTSARPATSPAPATRRRPPPAPDARPRRGMPPAHRGRAASRRPR